MKIKLHDKGALKNCKHRWNNGTEVIIIDDDVDTDLYRAQDAEGNQYLIGAKNFISFE